MKYKLYKISKKSHAVKSVNNILDCMNGDVKIDEDDVPMIYWIDSWVPICGHYFWNNQIGANKFCQKMGYHYGVVSGKGQEVFYTMDSFKLGQCDSDDAWLQCGGGCNDNSIGGKCADDINIDCSAGQPVKINITCEGTSSKTTSCEGISCKNSIITEVNECNIIPHPIILCLN